MPCNRSDCSRPDTCLQIIWYQSEALDIQRPTDWKEEDGNESGDDVAPHVETPVREGDTAAVLEVFKTPPAQNRSWKFKFLSKHFLLKSPLEYFVKFWTCREQILPSRRRWRRGGGRLPGGRGGARSKAERWGDIWPCWYCRGSPCWDNRRTSLQIHTNYNLSIKSAEL